MAPKPEPLQATHPHQQKPGRTVDNNSTYPNCSHPPALLDLNKLPTSTTTELTEASRGVLVLPSSSGQGHKTTHRYIGCPQPLIHHEGRQKNTYLYPCCGGDPLRR
ncbi:Hypothetical predicted protein, partial [Pelobates cultripes]